MGSLLESRSLSSAASSVFSFKVSAAQSGLGRGFSKLEGAAVMRCHASSRGSKANGSGLPMEIFLKSGCAGLSR